MRVIESETHVTVLWQGNNVQERGTASADRIGDTWWINRVLVQPLKARRRGIGSRLLQELIQAVGRQGGPLKVFPDGYDQDRESQFRFYEKNGFVREGEEMIYVAHTNIVKLRERILKRWGPHIYSGSVNENTLVTIAVDEMLLMFSESDERNLTLEQAVAAEEKLRRMEDDPKVTKRALRLFMQGLMPCGHTYSNLLTCPDPPYGCVACRKLYNEDGSEWKGPDGQEQVEGTS